MTKHKVAPRRAHAVPRAVYGVFVFFAPRFCVGKDHSETHFFTTLPKARVRRKDLRRIWAPDEALIVGPVKYEPSKRAGRVRK